MSSTRRSPPDRSRARRPAVQRVPALPSRMAATDALFWYAESALPEFRLPAAGVVETVPALDLAILALWFAGAGALVYRGLARYDVR